LQAATGKSTLGSSVGQWDPCGSAASLAMV